MIPLRRAAAPALCALVLVGSGRLAEAAETPVYIPAGVTDDTGSVACVRTAEGGVEAIELAGGRTIFRSAPPSRALLIASGSAWLLEERPGRALQLAIYSTGDGRLEKTIDLGPLALPGWATLAGGVVGREWTLFDAEGCLEGDRFALRYDIRRMRASGFRGAEVVDQASGVAAVLIDSGRILRAGNGSDDRLPLTRPAPPESGAHWLAMHARRPDATLMLGGPPANAEGLLVRGDDLLGLRFAEGNSVVLAQRFSTAAAPLGDPVRLTHDGPTDAVWVTLDRSHLLLRRAQDQTRYDLYDLATGLAIDLLVAPVDVAVVAGRVFWTTWRDDGRLVLESRRAGARRRDWRRIVRLPDPPAGAPIP